MGGKWHCFVINIPWHRISSENLKKLSSVKNKTPYWGQRAFDYIREIFNLSREMGSGCVKLAISTQN